MRATRQHQAAWTRLTCFLVAAVISACYESSSPLSPPGEIAHDVNLLGTWRCVPEEENSDEHANMRVLPFDESQYYVEWNEGDNVTRYRAYGSRTSGATVLNVQELKFEETGSSWVFLRYRIEATGDLRLSVVRKESVKGDSEGEKLDFIREHAVEEQLYEPFALCRKAK